MFSISCVTIFINCIMKTVKKNGGVSMDAISLNYEPVRKSQSILKVINDIQNRISSLTKYISYARNELKILNDIKISNQEIDVNDVDKESKHVSNNLNKYDKEIEFLNTKLSCCIIQRAILEKNKHDTMNLNLITAISSLGFDKSVVATTLKNMQNDIEKYNLDNEKFLEIIINRLFKFKDNYEFKKIVSIMQEKNKNHSCESIIKLLLHQNSNDNLKNTLNILESVSKDIYSSIGKESEAKLSDVEKIIGYILSLNLNKEQYVDMLLSSSIKLNVNRIDKYQHEYANFVKINELANKDPRFSKLRRDILVSAELLESHLQRDPEEAEIYDQQMAAALEDKLPLLSSLDEALQQSQPISVIDIGPAGGAIFKAVANACSKHKDNKIGYIGVEFDKNELSNLNTMLCTYEIDNQRGEDLIKSGASFVQGNALNLKEVINSLKQDKLVKNENLVIVLSSVIHEIYSYCPNNVEQKNTKDITTLVEPSNVKSYNPETVYKIYEEGILALATNGGTLNIRDGVMYKNPEEDVVFSLEDVSWIEMFKQFIGDSKYKHLEEKLAEQEILLNELQPGQKINLKAKYVQEFMIKANWGSASFGNEIEEVYCYMKLEDHLKLIQRAADNHNISIKIEEQKSYTQAGYKEHITEKQIKIHEGFGNTKFPPTNMVLKIKV